MVDLGFMARIGARLAPHDTQLSASSALGFPQLGQNTVTVPPRAWFYSIKYWILAEWEEHCMIPSRRSRDTGFPR